MIGQFDYITLILLGVTGVLFLIQLIYLLWIYNLINLRNKRTRPENNDLPTVSVIIVAKNSLTDLKKNLPLVLNQDYPSFEVIVIYEQDEDVYDDELKLLEEQYKNLYHTFIPDTARYISHKKLAVTMGIKAAKNDWLVFTEPDAYPASDQWLKKMAANFVDGKDIVVGYSNYEVHKGWFNYKISFDRMMNMARSMGIGMISRPYTANGYNLAYRKSFFYKTNAFSRFLNLQRGEDDLLVNQFANRHNSCIETSPESVVRINHPDHRFVWREDKLSRLITLKYFKGCGRFFAGFDTLTRFLFLISVIGTAVFCFLQQYWIAGGIALGLWLIRLILQIIIYRKLSISLNERKYYPLAELNKRIFKSANRFVVNVVYILKDCKCTYFP